MCDVLVFFLTGKGGDGRVFSTSFVARRRFVVLVSDLCTRLP